MHAYRKLVEDEMAARQWVAADLSRASGVSKQVLSNLLGDTREQLVQRPTDATVDGLARAFSLDRDVVLGAVGEAMGLPMSRPVYVYDAGRVSDDDLLRVLGERLRARKEGGERERGSAPMNPAGGSPAPIPLRPRMSDPDDTLPSSEEAIAAHEDPSVQEEFEGLEQDD